MPVRPLLPFSASAALLLLTGCAVTPSGTAPTPEASAAGPSAYEVRIAEVREELRQVCFDPDLQAYFQKTPCLASSITDAMTRERSRITPQERLAAEAVFTRTQDINTKTLVMMEQSGSRRLAALAALARSNTAAVDALQESLLSGRITWGEYNAERRALHERIAGNNAD